MRFTAKQVVTLSNVLDKLGAILETKPLNDPLMVGLAKAYALSALAYSEVVIDRAEV